MVETVVNMESATLARRLVIWLCTIATVVLAPLLNFGIALATNLDLASFALYAVIPVGTFALCALACGGFIFGSTRSLYRPDAVDLVFLMIASIGTIVVSFLVEYVYLMMKFDASPARLGTFGHFVFTSITEAQYQSYSRTFGLSAPVQAGDEGFLIMIVRVAGAAAVAKAVHSSMVSRAINLS